MKRIPVACLFCRIFSAVGQGKYYKLSIYIFLWFVCINYLIWVNAIHKNHRCSDLQNTANLPFHQMCFTFLILKTWTIFCLLLKDWRFALQLVSLPKLSVRHLSLCFGSATTLPVVHNVFINWINLFVGNIWKLM